MKITLKNITLKNFKAIKYISLDFKGNTILYGENALGKTTIFDGFMYALFESNSNNRSCFSIKTLDDKGKEIPHLEHEASVELNIDGKNIRLTAGIRDKWIKENSESVFKGNEHYYKINNVPVSQSKYKRRIGLIAKEEILKLITNTSYFCNMNWQESRKIIMDMCGYIPFAKISNSQTAEEIDRIGYNLLEKETRIKINNLKEHIQAMPIKREELNKSIINEDFSTVEYELTKAKDNLERLKKIILGKESVSNTDKKRQSIEKRLYEIREAFNIKYTAIKKDKANKINKANLKLSSLCNDQIVYCERLSYAKEKLNKVQKDIEHTANEIIEREKSEFDKGTLICPFCARPLTSKDRIAKISEFNKNKEESIRALDIKLTQLKNSKNNCLNEISTLNTKIENIKNEIINENINIDAYKNIQIKEFEPDTEYTALKQELENMDISEKEKLRAEYENCCENLNILNIKKFRMEQNKRIYKRIEDNINEEKSFKNRLKEKENTLDEIHSLLSLKAEYIEKAINSQFSIVKFKLFKKLINGNIEDCCIPTVNGVPYKDLNTAMKINCGIDIINTLSAHFNIYAPVFIDNREAITKLAKSNSQLISLAVKENCNKITLKEEI